MSQDHLSTFASYVSPATWRKVAYVDETRGMWSMRTEALIQNAMSHAHDVRIQATTAAMSLSGVPLSKDSISNLIVGTKSPASTSELRAQAYDILRTNWTTDDTASDVSVVPATIQHHFATLSAHDTNVTPVPITISTQENTYVGSLGSSTVDDDQKTQVEIQTVFEWMRATAESDLHHPLIIIAVVAFAYARLRPFGGIGYLETLLLTQLLLHKAGYTYQQYSSLEHLVLANKKLYRDAFVASGAYTSTKDAQTLSSSPWFTFFLSLLETQADHIHELLLGNDTMVELSEKQQQVLQFFRIHKEGAPKAIERETHIVRPTINQALDKLLKLNLIERVGKGRATRYILKRSDD